MSLLPAYQQVAPIPVRSHDPHFKHGLFSCCSAGFGHCIYAFLFPQCSQASARADFDSSNCFFNCLCLNHIATYNIIREGYAIEGDCCTDILVGACCPCCAVVRIQSEVEARGPRVVGMS